MNFNPNFEHFLRLCEPASRQPHTPRHPNNAHKSMPRPFPGAAVDGSESPDRGLRSVAGSEEGHRAGEGAGASA